MTNQLVTTTEIDPDAYCSAHGCPRATCDESHAEIHPDLVTARYRLRVTDAPGQPSRIYTPDGADLTAVRREADDMAYQGPVGGTVEVIDSMIDHPDRNVVHRATR